MRFSPIRNDAGEMYAVLHMSREITERRRLEEELRESERTLRFLAENAHDVIALYDCRFALQYVSPATKRFGYTADEVVDSGIMAVIHPDDRQKVQTAFDHVMQTEEKA